MRSESAEECPVGYLCFSDFRCHLVCSVSSQCAAEEACVSGPELGPKIDSLGTCWPYAASCSEAAPCVEGFYCSDQGACHKYPTDPACNDKVLDGAESDTDCGGTDCDPCDTGETCRSDSDCDSRVCTDETCMAPDCSDDTMNGEETGVDSWRPVPRLRALLRRDRLHLRRRLRQPILARPRALYRTLVQRRCAERSRDLRGRRRPVGQLPPLPSERGLPGRQRLRE